MRAVDQGNDNSAREPVILSEEELRELLDESDRRKEEEIRSKGRIVSLVMGIPLLAIITWAVVFLATYRWNDKPADEVEAAPVAPTQSAREQQEMGEYDSFRPAAQRVNPPAETPGPSGKVIDKGDIDFAIQLLNFSHASDPKPGKH